MWGPKARGWLASAGQDYHGVLFTEAHEADTSKAVRYMRKHGFVATGAKANATGLGGTTGGVLVGLLSHLTFWYSPPTWAPPDTRMVGWDWQAVLVRVRLTTLVVFTCYFTSGDPDEVNATKFRQILETKTLLGLPSILIGDFNATPQAVADLGWPRLWKGHILIPPLNSRALLAPIE